MHRWYYNIGKKTGNIKKCYTYNMTYSKYHGLLTISAYCLGLLQITLTSLFKYFDYMTTEIPVYKHYMTGHAGITHAHREALMHRRYHNIENKLMLCYYYHEISCNYTITLLCLAKKAYLK